MFSVEKITSEQAQALLAKQENHVLDFKSKDLAPSMLTKYISGFANADGGEIYLGIEEEEGLFKWNGFMTVEEYNSHVQVVENLSPISSYLNFDFIEADCHHGVILKITISKSHGIIKSSDGKVYIRRSAQCLPVAGQEALRRLEYAKGIISFETEQVNCPMTEITNSSVIIEFILDVVPMQEPEVFLRKQYQIIQDRPIVSGVLLFAEEPQAILPKRCGIKIYRYATSDALGIREAMVFDPVTIEGCLYSQIYVAVNETMRIIGDAKVLIDGELKAAEYPHETIHEVVTNAVIHRDYSIQDDIHIRIFDNRVEVESPGRLPGHVTVANILTERCSRNGNIVRIINRFKNPPNKDIGEGLNTAFTAMHRMNLKEPVIEEMTNSVLVRIRHEPLSSPEELVMKYLESNAEINNSKGREVCYIGSENKMKRVFEKLMRQGLIERIPEKKGKATAYRKISN